MRMIAGIFGMVALLLCTGCGRPEPSGEDLARTFRDNRALLEESRIAFMATPFEVEFDGKGRMSPYHETLPPPQVRAQLKALWAKTKVHRVFAGPQSLDLDMWDIGIVGSGRSKGILYSVQDEEKLNVVPSLDAFQDRSEGTHVAAAQKLDDHWYITLDQ